MSVSVPPPGQLDPNSAFSAVPDGPIPRVEREPTGISRLGLALLGLILAAGAIAWLGAVVLQLLDFFSSKCNLFACGDHSLSDHVRTYGEAIIGITGVVEAARSSYRSFRLIHAYGHVVALRRGVLSTLALLVIWSVLMGSH